MSSSKKKKANQRTAAFQMPAELHALMIAAATENFMNPSTWLRQACAEKLARDASANRAK